MIKHRLSPSLIARFFYHNCERYLRFHATPIEDRPKAGIPALNHNQSPVTKALLDAGNRWEEQVVLEKIKENVIIPEGAEALHKRAHSIKNSVEIFKKLDRGELVYQPTLLVSSKFYRKYNLSPELCSFSACRPDLIRGVERDAESGQGGLPRLQVIDVKASDELSSSHRIQATLYALMLKDVLEKNKLETEVDLDRAGIWLYGQDEPELFELDFNIKIIEEFLRYRLPEILTKPLETVPWHVYQRCELCDFYQHCRKEAEECNSVSLLPELSVSGRNYLREANWASKASINSLPDLEAFLEAGTSDDILDKCGALRNKGNYLRNMVRALQEKEIILNQGISLALPKNEDVSLFITLQKDPATGQIYTAGFRRFRGKFVYGNVVNERVYVAETSEKCTEIQHKFLQALFAELKSLHDYNEALEWNEQKSLQTYVFDNYERELFKALLKEAVKTPELAALALSLLFYYQDPSLFSGKQHPLEKVQYPIVALTNEIRKLLCLPIPFFLHQPEVTRALPASDFECTLKPSSLFWFEHSNAMKSDAISMAWEKKNPEAPGWIEKEISMRLLAASSVLDGLREKVKASLISWPPKFRIPASKKYNYPEISQLIFITRYEAYIRNLEIKEKRSLSLPERVKEGISVPIQYLEQNFWKVTSDLDSGLFEQNENFSYLLVPEGKAGENAQLSFEDYKYRTNLRNPGRSKVCFAMISRKMENERTGKIMGLILELAFPEAQPPFKTGDKAILHPRFTDFTSERIIDRLTEMDEQLEHDFIKLLRTPEEFAVPVRERDSVYESAKKQALNSGFTESQKRAFTHLLNNRLTLIWGPPGTGKTHFLARAILSLIRARRKNRVNIQIAVTAFTHSAVENLLIRIQELAEEDDFGEELHIYKLKEAKTLKGKNVLQIKSEYAIQDLADAPFLILGGTVNSFNKISRKVNPFDILIVDEASQLKPAELALGMSVLETGKRLVLAGDDLQLPPIIAGQYPDPEDGLPGLYDSIFSYLRRRDNVTDPKYTCQLLENWRMNETLSMFPATTLYGNGYKPASEKIARQKLKLLPSNLPETTPEPESEFIKWVLDPEYPISVVILENTQASVENEIEAELVAKLAVSLRETLSRQEIDEPYPDNEKGDSNFWKNGLFIVSPHRAQIRIIQTHLSKLRKWLTRPFVDTVDKTQGQEADAVIVSYGVSDTDTAMNEAEFIYSLNRLNVSITRAKAKCIVFLPRPLLEPGLELIQNKKAADGLNHMLNLVEFCRENGEKRDFELELSYRESYRGACRLRGVRANTLNRNNG
ncbi:MAG: AAA domain-containing protein [Methanosarcinaceae archaeon]|nr:AAA domain-containing protein [Methanosarcinaceae archaeon]